MTDDNFDMPKVAVAFQRAAIFNFAVNAAQRTQAIPKPDDAFYDRFAAAARAAKAKSDAHLLKVLGLKFTAIADADIRLVGTIPPSFRADTAAMTRWLIEPVRRDDPHTTPLHFFKAGRVGMAADFLRVKSRELQQLTA